MTVEEYLSIQPYSLNKDDKNKFLLETLIELNNKHYNSCKEYKSIIDSPNDWAREALKWSVDKINYCGIEKWDLKLIIKELEDRYTKSLKGDINE